MTDWDLNLSPHKLFTMLRNLSSGLSTISSWHFLYWLVSFNMKVNLLWSKIEKHTQKITLIRAQNLKMSLKKVENLHKWELLSIALMSTFNPNINNLLSIREIY